MAARPSDRTLKALYAIERLGQDEAREIAALGLPLYESLVVGYLRAACRLLEQDANFTVAARDQAWTEWQNGINLAIEGAMRFRENEPMVMAIGVLGGLLPGVYAHATLRGFKSLEDALLTAQRGALALKRERSKYRLRMRDRISRVSVWVGPAGDILQDQPLNDEQRRALSEHGYQNVWGVSFNYHQPEGVAWLVRAVLPVVVQPGDGVTLTAPRPDVIVQPRSMP
ncbi:MAG TPA: hypothetical protein VKY39_10255 [Aggregatilineales bacterium]|nr:hypothetical protein [Aggregatilineales bacterium]